MAQVVLVTGASTGIGRRIAGRLAQRGYRVFGTSRSPGADRLDGFELLPLDVTSDESVKACIEAVLARAGQLDVLVNNAGVELLGAIEEISLDEAKWIFETNFFGTLRMIQAVLPHLRAQRSGLIVNISSLAGLGGSPFQGMYVASKHALEGLTESLWYEVEPFNIRVALVEPGFFKSEIGQRKRLPAHPLTAYSPLREQVISRWDHALENGPDPAPVADAVLALIEGKQKRLRTFVGQELALTELKYLAPDWLVRQRIRWMFGLDDLFTDLPRGLPLLVWGTLLTVLALVMKRRR